MSKGSRINGNFADLWSGRWESNPRPKLGKLHFNSSKSLERWPYRFGCHLELEHKWSIGTPNVGPLAAAIAWTAVLMMVFGGADGERMQAFFISAGINVGFFILQFLLP